MCSLLTEVSRAGLFFLLTLQEEEIYVAGEITTLLMRLFLKDTTFPKEVEGKMICMCGKNGIRLQRCSIWAGLRPGNTSWGSCSPWELHGQTYQFQTISSTLQWDGWLLFRSAEKVPFP